jgi:hypothetical protein
VKSKAILGYDLEKADQYFTLLETELVTLDRQREVMDQSFELEEAELLAEIGAHKQKVSELERIETSLKQWIQRNQN